MTFERRTGSDLYGGLPQIRVTPLNGAAPHLVKLPEEICALAPGVNLARRFRFLRLRYVRRCCLHATRAGLAELPRPRVALFVLEPAAGRREDVLRFASAHAHRVGAEFCGGRLAVRRSCDGFLVRLRPR